MYRHRMDVISLVFGLLYAGIGASLVAGSFDFGVGAVWPILLVLAGLALLISAMRSSDRRAVRAEAERREPTPEDQ